MTGLLGVSGAHRHACAAVCFDGEVRAVCEQERVTRTRGEGAGGAVPREAINEVMAIAGCRSEDIDTVVVAEPDLSVSVDAGTICIDHHQAHAATAFFTAGYERAAVLVCDGTPGRELTVWMGRGTELEDRRWRWEGLAFATLYTECARVFGFSGRANERQLEALARIGGQSMDDRADALFALGEGTIVLQPGWRAQLAGLIEGDRSRHGGLPVAVAAAVQRRLGELLLEVCTEIRADTGANALCLGGGLFFNTYFSTLIRQSGLFDRVFVPINPGNAGLSVGAALMVSREQGHAGSGSPLSPFLGPAYDSDAIKGTLDSCKLSYAFASEAEAIDLAAAALARGQLVGWFQGRMEWGPRALGHRNILADPCSPYALDNLNCFLRKRERWRPFGVSVCEDDLAAQFCGPPASPYMEFEYRPRNDRLRHIMPREAAAIRVHSVGSDDRSFWELHKRTGQRTGSSVLVSTSLNGFNEPIACTPRDAVRVFYGSGLDMLVIGPFVLRK